MSSDLPRRVLAFDFGLRHIGVASGQTITGAAAPLPELRANRGEPDWPAVVRLVREWRPDVLLVGLPLNMDDTDNAITVRARAFALALHRHTGLDVRLVDERLSTRAAHDALGAGREHRHHHGMAACVIAETWLNDLGFPWPAAE